jgi:hypothetical protein
MMPTLNSDEKDKNIWSVITVEQLAAAIASLSDRIKKLDHETWRLNAELNFQLVFGLKLLKN